MSETGKICSGDLPGYMCWIFILLIRRMWKRPCHCCLVWQELTRLWRIIKKRRVLLIVCQQSVRPGRLSWTSRARECCFLARMMPQPRQKKLSGRSIRHQSRFRLRRRWSPLKRRPRKSLDLNGIGRSCRSIRSIISVNGAKSVLLLAGTIWTRRSGAVLTVMRPPELYSLAADPKAIRLSFTTALSLTR